MSNLEATSSPIASALVVDDDEFNREWISGLLTDLGVGVVHTAPNGIAALKCMRQLATPPDLLICDIFMPDMDGVEFLNKLIERRYPGRFMLISGMDEQTLLLTREIAEASGLHFLGAFVKPISRDMLCFALKLDHNS